MKRLALSFAIALVAGCASAPPAKDLEHDFEVGHVRYKLTREHGGSSLLLWREEGISWRLVSESPVLE